MNYKLIKLIIFINILLMGGQFLMTSKRSTDGEKIANLDNKLAELTQQNTVLKNRVLQFSSLAYVYEKAREYNMIPAKVTYFGPPSVALVKP